MTSPLITVLITTYNYGSFIEDAIESVLAQQFPLDEVEILVVDDGSTDDTADRVKKYGPRVRYLPKPNGGQASALNFGFAQASGAILCLLDADDLFLPSKLSRVAEAFQLDPRLGLVYHRTRHWDVATGQRFDDYFIPVSGNLRKKPRDFIYYTPVPTSGASFRRRLVQPLFPIPENIRMNADCFPVALIPFLAPVLAIPEFLGIYRLHGNNSFHAAAGAPLPIRQKRLLVWQTAIAEMRKWLDARGLSRDLAPVRSLIDRWQILIEREAFAVQPPSRFRFFRYLLRTYRYQPAPVTWRIALLNCLDAFAALFIGYRRFPSWQKWRDARLRRLAARGRGLLAQ